MEEPELARSGAVSWPPPSLLLLTLRELPMDSGLQDDHVTKPGSGAPSLSNPACPRAAPSGLWSPS